MTTLAWEVVGEDLCFCLIITELFTICFCAGFRYLWLFREWTHWSCLVWIELRSDSIGVRTGTSSVLSPTYLTEAAGVETSSLFPLWVITLLFLSMVIPFFVGMLCQHDTIKHMLCLHHLHIYIVDLLFMEVSNIIVARVLPSNLHN